jgi:hypothetical protein
VEIFRCGSVPQHADFGWAEIIRNNSTSHLLLVAHVVFGITSLEALAAYCSTLKASQLQNRLAS